MSISDDEDIEAIVHASHFGLGDGRFGGEMGDLVTRWEIWWRDGIFGGEMGYLVASWDIWWRDGIFGGEMGYLVARWEIW
jgi:hypothetical protein